MEQGGEQMAYKRVEELWTLGTLLDGKGRASTSVQARIRIASRHYFRNHGIWSKPGNERMKITRLGGGFSRLHASWFQELACGCEHFSRSSKNRAAVLKTNIVDTEEEVARA